MKIIIEGEPKEIAALELALKDGKDTNTKTVIYEAPTARMKQLLRHPKISTSHLSAFGH